MRKSTPSRFSLELLQQRDDKTKLDLNALRFVPDFDVSNVHEMQLLDSAILKRC